MLLIFKENILCEKFPLGIFLRMADINMVFIFSHRCRILIKSNNSDKLYLLLYQSNSKINVYVESFKSENRKSFIARVH